VDLGYRTIYMPNRIHVDATAAVVKLRHVGPRILEPGSRLKVRYLLNEPARSPSTSTEGACCSAGRPA
jgi:hypothetical protein